MTNGMAMPWFQPLKLLLKEVHVYSIKSSVLCVLLFFFFFFFFFFSFSSNRIKNEIEFQFYF